MKAILKKDAKRRKKIEAAGIEYDYPDIVSMIFIRKITVSILSEDGIEF
jgi:hypothetical protein